MFVELDTDIEGACLFLQSLTRANVLDCMKSDPLLRELYRRVETPGLCVYQREEPDVWTSFATYVRARRIGKKRLVGDCEDLTGIMGSYLALRQGHVWVCITQPHGQGMAHAYNRVYDAEAPGTPGAVRDFSVECGMRPPRSGFYDDPASETHCFLVEGS